MLLLEPNKKMAEQLLQIMLEEQRDYEEYILYLVVHEECGIVRKTKFKDENPLSLIKLIAPILKNSLSLMQNKIVKIAPVVFTTQNGNGRNVIEHRHDFIDITPYTPQPEHVLAVTH